MKRPDAAIGGAAGGVLFIVYALTLAPDVTFWDAGEFIASAHSLGIPHPPGTPLFVLLVNVWAKLLVFHPYAVATNLFSAAATALAVGLTARVVQRGMRNNTMALAAALVAGGMSSVWLNATETEVYAASLALGALTIWCGDRAGREPGERWTYLTAYLIALAVPLHLSALVAAPAAIVLAANAADGIRWRRGLMLLGVLLFAIGVGRMSWWMAGAGAAMVLGASARRGASVFGVSIVAASVLAFLYLRAPFDPAINQGNPATLASLVDVVARRQYAVAPMWPRQAPAWVQLGNLGQYADWQVALSFGPTVLPSVLRSLCTVAFVLLGYQGAVTHWRADRRTWIGIVVLFLCGSLGVLVYLNLHAGPSIGYGILAPDAEREARERDYFYVFAFWAWGIWAGVGAVSVAKRLGRPAWTGVLIASLPLVLNWRAVTRRSEPERSLPRTLAEGLLEATPRSGVLFVSGDNDSYPLWYAQEVLRVRRDVAVITIPLLPTDWYRAQIAMRFGLLASADVEFFDGRLESAAQIAHGARTRGRPVAAAMTLTAKERESLGDGWTVGGMVYVEQLPLTADRSPSSVSGRPRAAVVDRALAGRWAAWVEKRLGRRQPRDAIDPVHSYFRRMLDCPRQLATASGSSDSTRLDSACNYR